MQAKVLLAGLACTLLGPGCGEPHDHSHEGHGHGEAEHGGGHVHVAPHGGLLVVLGEESAHAEFLLDADSLTVWLLDGEAENPLRSAQTSLSVELQVEGAPQTFELAAVARELTGETVGDTSEFHVQDPAIRNVELAGTIERVEVLGATFVDVPIVAEEGH